ncbi:MAG: thioredoxin domain-containing protein [Halobacteriota archaeon]
MTDPTERNRLGDEQSPYLRQHADNPVHWQPWDDTALEAARERDVPVFLSIGYSACHWCHVMEEESFADEIVADVLNEEYVPIKVDREERPDLDSVYLTICQLVTGGGGWPLSVWLTPDGRPFYVGTYFPREPRQGIPGFLELVENLAHSWQTDRDEIEQRADQWTAALTDNLEATPQQPGEVPSSILDDATNAALRGADREFGGFGTGGPKFPNARRVELLLRSAALSGRKDALEVATEALDAMAVGGLYDHVGGGFHRYVTDRQWRVPHFEKMLYDNAELPRVYLAGFRATGRERYVRLAQETFAFVERDLTHPEGGFFSTLDAQSGVPDSRGDAEEVAEGAFYVWTPEEVHAAVDDDLTADLTCEYYGITDSGNFEGGTTVLSTRTDAAALAETHDTTAGDVEERLTAAQISMFDAREERPRPARDEKVLAGWNGLMVSAFSEGALTLDPALAESAVDALDFVRTNLWDADTGRLARRYKDGDVGVDGYLEDYAFLGRGAFDLYQATGGVEHLAFALNLTRAMLAEFWDDDAGTLYFTPESGERLVTRPQERMDQSTPSSLGVAVGLLLDLEGFTVDDDFGGVAARALETHADRIRASPLEHVSLALAADRHARGATELTVAADRFPDAWRETLAERYLPGVILSVRPPTADGLDEWLSLLDLDGAPPIWAGRDARGGKPTVYACESFTCSPPKHDLSDALAWLEGR